MRSFGFVTIGDKFENQLENEEGLASQGETRPFDNRDNKTAIELFRRGLDGWDNRFEGADG